MFRKNAMFSRLLCITVIFSLLLSISAIATTSTPIEQSPVLYSSASVADVSDDILDYLKTVGVNVTEKSVISAGKLDDNQANAVYSRNAISENEDRETYYVTVSDKVGDEIETTTVLRFGTATSYTYSWPPDTWDTITMVATAYFNCEGEIFGYVQPQKVHMYYTVEPGTTATFVSTVFGCTGNRYSLPNYINQGPYEWAAVAVSYNPTPNTTYSGYGQSMTNYVILPEGYSTSMYFHFRYKLAGDAYETDQLLNFTLQDLINQ